MPFNFLNKLDLFFNNAYQIFVFFDKRIYVSILIAAIAIACTTFLLFILSDKNNKLLRFFELIAAIFFLYCIVLLQKHNSDSVYIGLGIGFLACLLKFPEIKDQILLVAEYFGIRIGSFSKSMKKDISKVAEERIQNFTPPPPPASK